MSIEKTGIGSLEKEPEFDKEGLHYFVNSGHVSEVDGCKFISSAYIDKKDFEDRILYVEFRDGYLGDFTSGDIASNLDEQLEKIEGIEKVNWEDREFFHITFKEGQKIPELLKKIDAVVTELSKK